MKVNPRKPYRLKNTSKYWSPETCRTHVRFSSPESYQSFKIKQEGYESRLYWQFRYCQEHHGQTFYYTLTYNDANIPQYLGHNCFDYEDLRELFTGAFRKILLRKYGTVFKYFVGAELGDGKGERGMHNNPHYHVLFFLEPCPDGQRPLKTVVERVQVSTRKRTTKFGKKGDPIFKNIRHRVPVEYVPISPVDFRHLIRLYWQGFDEDVTGFQDYRTAKFGIAREGDELGKVSDFRACCYCAKYVTKDAGLKKLEADVEKRVRARFRLELRNSPEFHNWFFRGRLWKDFNTPLNASNTEWFFPTASSLIWHLLPHDLFDSLAFTTEDLTIPVFEICRRYHYWKQYYESFDEFLEMRVKESINEYRNRYCNKPRISHGVGDYALSHIDVKFNPLIPVPSKDGVKYRPLSLYFYRKLFTEVHIDKKGSPIRVLNEDGISYKLSRISRSIERMSSQAASNLALLLENKSLFERMRESDVNTDVGYHFSRFCKVYNSLLKDYSLSEILKRYAEYKLVYEDRFFPYHPDRNFEFSDFPSISLLDDYRRFLQPSYFTVSRSDLRLDIFLENGCPDTLPYIQHPYFLPFSGLFRVLDLCSDYFFIQDDIKKQKEADEVAAVKRFHDKRILKSFYSQFSIYG